MKRVRILALLLALSIHLSLSFGRHRFIPSKVGGDLTDQSDPALPIYGEWTEWTSCNQEPVGVQFRFREGNHNLFQERNCNLAGK